MPKLPSPVVTDEETDSDVEHVDQETSDDSDSGKEEIIYVGSSDNHDESGTDVESEESTEEESEDLQNDDSVKENSGSESSSDSEYYPALVGRRICGAFTKRSGNPTPVCKRMFPCDGVTLGCFQHQAHRPAGY